MDEVWVEAGSADTLQQHGRALLRVQGLEIALFAHGGACWAIEDSCPHAGASLCNGRVDNGQVRCPAHGLSFDLRNGQMRGTSLRARVFAVREMDGRLQVRLP
jgi:3-phenylpropionate/trans-cinnamate dioxygenase ferredoxin subunit